MTPEALQKRRSDGLCFRCPERYYPGHKCNPPQFLLIADNEPFDHDEVNTNSTENFPTPATLQPTNPNQFFALSSAAFFGLSSAQALRVTGFINNKPVQVLIDSGSTHNIIQPRIVSFLNLPKQDIPEFAVMVGNGESLKCQAVCPSISLAIQDASFNIPVFVLPVAGADIILGLAWLQTLGPVLADFAIPQLTFNVGPKAITLRGEPLSTQVSPASLHTLISKHSVASFHALYFSVSDQQSLNSPEIPTHDAPAFQQLLHAYAHTPTPSSITQPPHPHFPIFQPYKRPPLPLPTLPEADYVPIDC